MPLQIGKTPIVVPRQHRFNEHVNDHQVEFARNVAQRMGTIIPVEDINTLGDVITNYDQIVTGMLCEHIRFSDEVLSIVNKEATSLNISECIGVYIRGTDYVKLKPSGEYVQPSVDQMKCKIHEFENKYSAPIFLVTEDGDIFDNLKKEFGDIVRIVSFDTFIRNYEGKDVLSKSDVLEKDKKLRGQKYLAKMILLAKCKYFVGSMTQGSKFSYILNNGNYSDEYVFDLGLYP